MELRRNPRQSKPSRLARKQGCLWAAKRLKRPTSRLAAGARAQQKPRSHSGPGPIETQRSLGGGGRSRAPSAERGCAGRRIVRSLNLNPRRNVEVGQREWYRECNFSRQHGNSAGRSHGRGLSFCSARHHGLGSFLRQRRFYGSSCHERNLFVARCVVSRVCSRLCLVTLL